MTKFQMTLLSICLFVPALAFSADSAPKGNSTGFRGPLGLQLYSLRAQFAKDVPGTLDKVREFGFKYVEPAGTYGVKPEKFKAELESRGLKAISGHFPYDKFRDDPKSIARDAKALGLQYAGCAWIAHSDAFTEKDCRSAANVF